MFVDLSHSPPSRNKIHYVRLVASQVTRVNLRMRITIKAKIRL